MAVLGKIRSNAALLVIVLAVALGAFIIGDALRSGSTWFQASKQVALNINGEKVPIQKYSKELQLKEEQIKAQGQNQLSDAQRMMINNQLAQQYIANYAVADLSKKVGINVSPEEVYALIFGGEIPASPMAKQFFSQLGLDPSNVEAQKQLTERLNQFDQLPAQEQQQWQDVYANWIELQKNIRANRLQKKLATLLSRTYKITDLETKLLNGEKGTREVALVRSSAMSLMNDSTCLASDEEIKKYYDEHKDFFRTEQGAVKLDYISVKVIPSADDYSKAEEDVNALYEGLLTSDRKASIDLLRNYSEKFVAPVYLTEKELDQLGVGAEEIKFIQTKPVGDVYKSMIINDRYNVIKLQDKKNGYSSMGIQVAVLDSAMSAKSDSILLALQKGASFEQLAREHSIDKRYAERGGRIFMPNRYGTEDSLFSEYQLAQMKLDTVFHAKLGSVISIDYGTNKMLVKGVDAQKTVEKYQILYTTIPVVFSEKTYNDKYAALNAILGKDCGFDEKIADAQKEGFSVRQNVVLADNTPELQGIPSSRPVISWAVKAEDGTMSEKLYTCGTDHLVIAKVKKHFEKGFAPLDENLQRSIKARLNGEKRAAKLAQQMQEKKLSDLSAYAEAMDSKVDTLVSVSYQVRGSEAPQFNGVAMTTDLGKLSEPFVAGQEVMVVQPLKETPKDAKTSSAQKKQEEADFGRQLSYRAFSNFLQSLDVEDNRSLFY